MQTVQEVEAKKTTLEAEQATALEAAKVLTPATAEFDEAYGRYLAAKASLLKIPDEIAAATLAANAELIATAGAQVAEAIGQLLTGLEVEKLVGKPVICLRYAVDSESKALVVFNPIIKVASTRKAGATKGGGRTVIVDGEGNRLSLTKFVLAHATEAEKATDEYKYPHALVATKPKFEAFCTGHSLTGYTYELPSETTEETPAS